jgi:hypothetical protein
MEQDTALEAEAEVEVLEVRAEMEHPAMFELNGMCRLRK